VNRIGVVVNPTAGGGRARSAGEVVLAALTELGLTVEDLSRPDARHALDHTRASAREGLAALVVVGGDGTVNLGVNAVAGTDVPLGIVAVGGGNDIARALGLPVHDPLAAVRAVRDAILDGPRAVDAVRLYAPDVDHPGAVDDLDEPRPDGVPRWFVGVLSAGLDAAVNARANALTWPRGTARYVRALAGELRRFRPYGYRLTVDGRTWDTTATLVSVANGPAFGGGMRIAPAARNDDGVLDIVVAGPLRRHEVVCLFPRLYRGSHVDHPALSLLRGREVAVAALGSGPHATPPPAFADGEPVGALPVHCVVHPGALLVLAPGARP
jgi:diacylglycerol kinase (ATP)